MIFGAFLSLLVTHVRSVARLLRGTLAEHPAGPLAPIADATEIVFEYLVWLLHWACWLLDWVFRLPLVLADLLGIRPRVSMGIAVKIVADDSGRPVVTQETAGRWLREAEEILDRIGIGLVSHGIELLPRSEFLDSTACGPSGIFRRFFTWFASHAGGGVHRVTIYVVRSMRRATGCAYPGCDWVVVSANADGTVLVHEIGHLSGLWKHSSDRNNVMTVRSGGSHDRISPGQRSMFRTSRFVRLLPRNGPEPAR